MTPRLDAIRERVEAATPGPWRSTTEGSHDQKHAAAKAYEAVMARRLADAPDIQFTDMSWVRTEGDDWLNVAMTANGPTAPENAVFIAAAREDVPLLLAEVERLRGALETAHRFLTQGSTFNEHSAPDTVAAYLVLDGALYPEAKS